MFRLTSNALTVLEKRYLLKDEHGVVTETPEALFNRVANTLAQVDRQYGASEDEVQSTCRDFLEILWALDFLPNSPTLANAGTRTGQLSACFVLPVPDDLGGIFEAIREAALIHQTGGGTGFSFSRLRPKGDLVGSTKGVSSGPVSFMDVFNAATESIKQGGMRRGANMGILRIDHPDILDFIRHKEDLTKLTNFNVSVALTDQFMRALERNETYALSNPRTNTEVARLSARAVFAEIVRRAHSTGEPGIVFLDRINASHPTPWLGEIESTNPCGEQPLLPYESCNLGSINLERMVVSTDGMAQIAWDKLRRTVHVAVHLLDNVIDANRFPIPAIAQMSKSTRKVGLGVMGFARMLAALGVGYASAEGRVLAEQVMSFIDYESKVASIRLAQTRGAFPAYREENRYLALWEARQQQPNRHAAADYLSLLPELQHHGIRNATTTTIAPTGTLSIIADTSGGIEPIFALAFKRFQADADMIEVDSLFLRTAKNQGCYSERLIKAIEHNYGSLTGLTGYDLPSQFLDIFITAHDIKPNDLVLLQAAFQKYNDSATSKTINFAEEATSSDVETAFMLAYQSGCKGITVYRDNTRQRQPLSLQKSPAEELPLLTAETTAEEAPLWQPRVRSEDLYGFTRFTLTGDGKLYTTINYDEHGMREVFTIVGRSGGTIFSLSEALGRLASLALQYNIPVDEIANKLIGIRGANPLGFGRKQILSIPDALGRVLKDAPRRLGSVLAKHPSNVTVSAKLFSALPGQQAVEIYGESPECPECGNRLEFGEGCSTCRGCGYSRCS
ncbi:MAG: vitamin B12-dependent ribonucleotide reductase [Cyanobacteria bacterium NC_groundwater_1444_Ag_S-0.65um_54_12]|nr:vitamin B12-dependent ribonucleotide reductase [Cyanobacteria bacterium NC_groundwater_1444_Ag_S-0.65um_54_12]